MPNFIFDPGEQYYTPYAMILCVWSTGFLRAPIMQWLSLYFFRSPFHIHRHTFSVHSSLKLTDFLTPIIQIWIFCPVASEFSTLQISATLDRFVWILFPTRQLSQGISTQTGPWQNEQPFIVILVSLLPVQSIRVQFTPTPEDNLQSKQS